MEQVNQTEPALKVGLLRRLFTRNLPCGAKIADPQTMREMLAAGRPIETHAANTGSMFPVIRGGERLKVSNWSFNDLKRGQYVVGETQARGVPAMHEIIGGDPVSGFITKGRGNPDADPFRLTPERYIGVWEIMPDST